MLYVKIKNVWAKFDARKCMSDKFAAEILVIYFFNTIIHLSPQIKLWGGISMETRRSKTKVKLCKIPYSSYVLWHKTENMVVASTTNHDANVHCLMDENEMNSISQKHPTMAQVIISQKKAKGKFIFESKHPPFWLGFQSYELNK